MGSIPDPGELTELAQPSFEEFQKQTSLMTSCTLLWQELSDHFTSLEQNLMKKSEALKQMIESLDNQTQTSLESLKRREVTIDHSVEIVAGKVSERARAALESLEKVHPITAVQLEWSLWTRDVEEEIVPTCRELGIGIVAYSPLGRGFFASGPKLVENLDKNDFRKALPRFQQENLDHNKSLYEKVRAMSEKKGCTPAQLALAWVHHQGDDVCPIPGTTKIENLNQNIGALSVKLTPEEISELETIGQQGSVKGERYMATVSTFNNSNTPPLSSWNAV